MSNNKCCKKMNIDYFSGSENDVLDRFYYAATKYRANNVVRITADCPLIDPEIVDNVIDSFFLKSVDYATNTNPPSFPDGMDVEIFKFSILKEAHVKAKKPLEREHVTPYIIDNKKIKKFNLLHPVNASDIRFIRRKIIL